jgi:hypothetical protein
MSTSEEPRATPSEIDTGLRNMALGLTPQRVGAGASPSATRPYGMLMETGCLSPATALPPGHRLSCRLGGSGQTLLSCMTGEKAEARFRTPRSLRDHPIAPGPSQ